jgi:hypothetical protein
MNLKAVVVGLAAFGGVAFTSGSALAMPNGLPQADQIAKQTANVEQVRWICTYRGRCFLRPGFYRSYGYYRGPYPGWRWRHPGWRWGY